MTVKLAIDLSSPVPLFLQVKELIIKEILDGRFDIGSRIPPMRRIEIDNSISRTTVERAYWLLAKEEYITKKGNAYFVQKAEATNLDEFCYN